MAGTFCLREQPYFRRLLLDQMLNHNLDFECARAIRDLELIPQITDSLSRLYKLNYEGRRFYRGSEIRVTPYKMELH